VDGARQDGLQKELAVASLKMDFSEPDAAPEDLLNRAIWHSVKGVRHTLSAHPDAVVLARSSQTGRERVE
jgi:hypothetical protein